MTCFLDANIPMYAVGGEHPYRDPCREIIRLVGAGAISAVTDAEVLQEILHRYLSVGRRGDASAVTRSFAGVVAYVLPVLEQDVLRALRVAQENPQLSARDALHVAIMLSHSITHVISADRHFALVPGITRLDPLCLADWLPEVSA